MGTLTGDSSLSAGSFTGARLRQVMGHVPTGVCIVAASTPDGPAGLTVGSFVSASLDPPYVAFFVARTSSSWPRIETAGHFTVNVLGEDGESICRRFAASGGDKFATVPWHLSLLGSPIIRGAVAWFDCSIETQSDVGDHSFIVARVHDLGVRSAGRPLVFVHGGYGRLHESCTAG
jgi:flavin reductase (DIM6/NTAB) family NADH-FMN oxidoreductase RutF